MPAPELRSARGDSTTIRNLSEGEPVRAAQTAQAASVGPRRQWSGRRSRASTLGDVGRSTADNLRRQSRPIVRSFTNGLPPVPRQPRGFAGGCFGVAQRGSSVSDSGRANGEGAAGVQVTRRRRRVSRAFGGARAMIAAGAIAVLLAGAGVTYATTEVFGHNQVGTEYANGIQVSDDQIIKPLGDRLLTQFGKFMGSTVSPDGRFLAATSTDKSVALQIFDLSSYKLIWTVGTAAAVNQKLTDGTVGQEGPTYSPDGNVPLASGAERPDPVPGQRRRHARHADHRPDPEGQRPLRPGGPDQVLARRLHPVRRDQRTEHRRRDGPRHRRRSSRRGTSASPRVSSRSSASKLYVSNEGGRQAQAGETTMDSYGTAGARQRLPRHVDDRNGQRHRHRAARRPPVGIDRRRPAPDRDVRQPATRCSSPTRTATPSRSSTPTNDKVVQTIATQPWPSSDVGYEPDEHRADRRRPPAGHARPRERRRRLPVQRQAAGAR